VVLGQFAQMIAMVEYDLLIRDGLKDRGISANGMKADIVVFNSDGIGDVGDHTKPRRRPRRIVPVIVNGEIVVGNVFTRGRLPAF